MKKINLLSSSGVPVAITEKAFRAIYAPKGYVIYNGILTKPEDVPDGGHVESLDIFLETSRKIPVLQISDLPPGVMIEQPVAVHMETGDTFVSARDIAEQMFDVPAAAAAGADELSDDERALVEDFRAGRFAAPNEGLPGNLIVDGNAPALKDGEYLADIIPIITDAHAPSDGVLTDLSSLSIQPGEDVAGDSQTTGAGGITNESNIDNNAGNLETGGAAKDNRRTDKTKRSNARK